MHKAAPRCATEIPVRFITPEDFLLSYGTIRVQPPTRKYPAGRKEWPVIWMIASGSQELAPGIQLWSGGLNTGGSVNSASRGRNASGRKSGFASAGKDGPSEEFSNFS